MAAQEVGAIGIGSAEAGREGVGSLPERYGGCLVAENREVVEGAGFTFQCGNVSDLADRIRFLIANPAVREAAGQAARKRVVDHYLWQKIAQEIESSYFEIVGSQLATGRRERLLGTAVTVTESSAVRRRAG